MGTPKTENFSISQRTLSIGQTNKQRIGKKFFTNTTSDRGLISNKYKEFKKLDSIETKPPNLKSEVWN